MAATPVGMKRFYAILAGVAVVGLGASGVPDVSAPGRRASRPT